MPYKFEPNEVLSEAFARVAREQLDQAQTAMTEELESDPVVAVHTARKSVKKERALLRLMRGPVAGSDRRKQNDALRRAARRLSLARDAEVMIAALDDLSERYSGQVPHTAFTALRERLEAERTIFGEGSVESEVAAQLATVRDGIAEWHLSDHGWAAIEPGLARTYERGRATFAQARKHPDDQHLHAWRKRAKDLWYQLRLLTPVCGETVRGQSKDAGLLGDLLGEDHDLAVLRVTLAHIGAEVATDLDAVVALLDHRREELQTQAMSLGERVYAERTKAFTGRIHSYWRAGRTERRAAQRRDPAELAEATRATPAH